MRKRLPLLFALRAVCSISTRNRLDTSQQDGPGGPAEQQCAKENDHGQGDKTR